MDNLDQDLGGLPVLKKTTSSDDLGELPILKKKDTTTSASSDGLSSSVDNKSWADKINQIKQGLTAGTSTKTTSHFNEPGTEKYVPTSPELAEAVGVEPKKVFGPTNPALAKAINEPVQEKNILGEPIIIDNNKPIKIRPQTKVIKSPSQVLKEEQELKDDAINNTIQNKKRIEKDNPGWNEASERAKLEKGLNNKEFELGVDPKTGKNTLLRSNDTGYYDFPGQLNTIWDNMKDAYQSMFNDQMDKDVYNNMSEADKKQHLENQLFLEEHGGGDYLPQGQDKSKAAWVGRNISQLGYPLLKASAYGAGAYTGAALLGAPIAANAAASELMGAAGQILPNAKQAANVMSFFEDMAKSSSVDNEQRVYKDLRRQGESSDEAFKKAQIAGGLGAVGGGLGAVAMGGAFQNIKSAATNVNVQPFINSLKHLAGESVSQGGYAAGGSLITDLGAKAAGYRISPEDIMSNSAEQFKNMAALSFIPGAAIESVRRGLETKHGAAAIQALGIVSGVVKASGAPKVPKAIIAQAKEVVSQLPKEDVQAAYDAAEQNGVLPQGSTQKIMTSLDNYNKTEIQIPAGLPPEVKASLKGLQEKINDLELSKSKLDKAYHPYMDGEIKKLRDKAQKILESGDVFSNETDDLGNPINNPKAHENQRDVTVGDMLDKRGTYNQENGQFYQEGQTIVFKPDNSNKIYEIGNADEMSSIPASKLGIKEENSSVGVNENGNVTVRGKEYVNNYSDPLQAINRDKEGNVVSVGLETPTGQKRTFKGNIAEDIAYQITLGKNAKPEIEGQVEVKPVETKAEIPVTIPKIEITPTKEKVVEKTTADTVADDLLTHLGITPTTEGEIPPAKKYTAENIDTISGEGLNDTQKKVISDVKNVVSSISNLVQKTTGNTLEVNIHETPASFEKAVIDAGGTKQDSSTKGFYLDSNGTIHLNMDKVTTETMLHEGFHPVLDYMAKNRPDIINDLHKQLEKINGGKEVIENTNEIYKDFDETTRKREAITDFIAKVADGSIEINKTNFEKIKDFVINAINKLGFDLGKDINTITDLKNLAQLVSEKFNKGEEIEVKDLGAYIKKAENVNTSDGIDNDYQLSQIKGNSDRGIQLSKGKENIKDNADETLKAVKTSIIDFRSIPNLKISRTLFYDNTRVGKLEIKNRNTGYTPNVDGKGGFFYSYMPEAIKNKAVLAFTSANQAIQTLKRQMLHPESAQAIAAQNFQTAHLGNKSTLKALFGEKSSKDLGIFQESVKGNPKGEKELLNALVKSTMDVANQTFKKGPKEGKPTASALEIKKIVDRNGGNLNNIKTLDDFRDKVLTYEGGDSFGARNVLFTEMLQEKPTKITKSTRDAHQIMHYKYGIPTLSEIAEGNNQQQLNNAETGDVIKLVKPYSEPIIYTTNKDIYKQYSEKPTDAMVENGIKIELLPESLNHESYPFVLRGENVGILDNYIAAPQMYQEHADIKDVEKKKSFYNVGRIKDEAPAGKFPVEPISEGVPQFSKENQDAKIKEFIDIQRKKGISDEDIKAGLDKVSDKIGLDKTKIDDLISGKETEKTTQITGSSRKAVAGLVQRLGLKEPEPGHTWKREEYKKRGQILLKNGAIPDDIDNRADFELHDRISIGEAHSAELQKEADKLAKTEPEGKNSVKYKDKLNEVQDFINRTSKLNTLAHNAMMALQGGTDLETGSFTAQVRRLQKVKKEGEKVTEEEKAKLQKFTDNDQKLQKEAIDSEAKFIEQLDNVHNEREAKKEAQRAQTYTEKAKKVADRFRKIKTTPFTFKDENGNDIPVQKMGVGWNELVELGAKAIEKTGEIADGVKSIIDAIKDNDWYNSLSDKDKIKLEKDLSTHYESSIQESPEAKNIKRLEKELENVRQGNVKQQGPKRELSEREKELKDKIQEEKEKLGLVKSKMEKPLTEDEIKQKDVEELDKLQTQFVDKKGNKFTPEESKTIWNYAKNTYYNTGISFDESIKKTAEDLGLKYEQVANAIMTPKTKPASAEMYAKRAQLNKNRQALENYIETRNESGFMKGFKTVMSIPKAAQTFGHSHVFIGTHAISNLTDPRHFVKTLKAVEHSYRFSYEKNPTYYESHMDALRNDPLFQKAKNAGLQNDPDNLNLDSEQSFQKYLGKFGKAGERGFNAVKVLRQEIFNYEYNKLDESQKKDEESLKKIAGLVNNWTGGTNIKGNEIVKGALFSASMEGSRWEKILAPFKVAGYMSKSGISKLNEAVATKIPSLQGFVKDATPSQKAYSKAWAGRAGRQLGTYFLLLGANTAIQNMVNPDKPVNWTHPTRPDFLLPKFGDHDITIDLSGGLLSTIGLLFTVGKIIGENQRYLPKGQTRGEAMMGAIGKYTRGKLSPLASLGIDAAFRRDFSGNVVPYSHDIPAPGKRKLGGWEYIASHFAPLPIAEGINETKKSALENGVTEAQWNDLAKGLTSGGVSFLTGAKLKSISNRLNNEGPSDNVRNYKQGGRLITDDEYDQYRQDVDKNYDISLAKLKKDGYTNDYGERVPYKKLEKEDRETLNKELNRLKTVATEKAKEDLFGKKPKEETSPEGKELQRQDRVARGMGGSDEENQ